MSTQRAVALTAAAALAAGSLLAACALGAGAAGAANVHAYYGYAGGSQIRAADATISSDLSVQSAIFRSDADGADRKHTAKLAVSGLLTTAAVSTSAVVAPVSGGRRITATARSAGVHLLGDAITIDAVTTTSTSTQAKEKLSSTASTAFAGIHIAGVTLPVSIPKNYSVTIPGVASVTLDYAQTAAGGSSTVSIGSGLVVTLLNPYAGNPLGSVIYLSPTYTAAGSGPPPPNTGHSIGGQAYGTSVSAKVGTVAGITSDPTASTTVGGRSGQTLRSAVAGVNVPGVLTAGGVRTSATGTNTRAVADARTSTALADVSLLGGLIKVKAVTAAAHAKQTTGHATALSGSSSLTGLVIAGRSMATTVKPNTTISLGSLGRVVVNEQIRSRSGTITVRALHVTLSTAGYGLAAGAQLQVGYASASAN